MALCSLVILAAVAVVYKSTSSLVEKTIYDHLHTLTADTSKNIDVWLEQQFKILNATASSINFEQMGDNKETLGPLKMAMKAGHFSDVYIGLPNGKIIDGADWLPPAGYDTRIRPWYLKAVEEGKPGVTRPYIDLVTMEFVIALVTPLVDQGRFYGVMSADTILDVIVENIVNLKVGESGYAFIVEKNGMILVHPKQDYVMKNKVQQIEPNLNWDEAISRKPEFGAIKFTGAADDNDFILSYQKVANTDWYVCIKVPRSEAYVLTQKSTMLSAVEIVLIALGALSLITLVWIGGSILVMLVFNRKFETTVNQQREELSGMNANLQWNINKRKEVEAYYQTLFEVANDAILLSRGLQYVDCNEKASEIFGLSRQMIIGQSMLDLSPETQPHGETSEARIDELIAGASDDEQQFFEWTFQRVDGTEFPAEVGLKVLHLDDVELTLASVRDISKRVDAEGQLRQAQKMAAMGEMLGAIAHQWRQPLNTLSTYIASLQSAYYNDRINGKFVDQLVTGADSQVQFMSKTIDDFRHFFKPSKHKTPFDLLQAIDSAIKLVEPQLKQGDVTLEVENQSRLSPLNIYGYQSEFVHVIVNILSNALDAIREKKEKSREPEPHKIRIEVVDQPSQVSIAMSDSGCGIPEHLLEKIFTPYFTTKGSASGTGIGLYMAKMIIEKEMNGHLLVENVVNGSKFTIQLPLGAAKGVYA